MKESGLIRTVQVFPVIGGARCGESEQIQPFGDNYLFCGPRTSQFEQVGNVFQPVLRIGTAISEGRSREEAACGDAPP
jgi:hypothetical protein